MKISVCIATYRRAERLAAVLNDVFAQDRRPVEIVVVDNDAAASARTVVESARSSSNSLPIRYDVQPIKNISITRNRTVALANEDWLAFIDDDERAPREWLTLLTQAVEKFGADGVLGPVVPLVPDDAPTWIRRGHFYDFPRMRTGEVIPPNRLRFGNVLLRGALVRGEPGPFDPDRGLTGGEDGELLSRLVARGAKIIWCDEAIVTEPVERSRLSLRWLLRRALSGGQDFARNTLNGTYGPISWPGRMLFFMRALSQALLAVALAAVSWPAGRHHSAHWLTKVSANLGKLSVFCGLYYREYA